jgi:hypothetical protein
MAMDNVMTSLVSQFKKAIPDNVIFSSGVLDL